MTTAKTNHHPRFGRAFIKITEPCALFEGIYEVGKTYEVWASHGDCVTALPPGFKTVAVYVDDPENERKAS